MTLNDLKRAVDYAIAKGVALEREVDIISHCNAKTDLHLARTYSGCGPARLQLFIGQLRDEEPKGVEV